MPFVDTTDPSPNRPDETDRWEDPYLSERSGLWTVFTRRPLTRDEVLSGLASFVSAESRDALQGQMDGEDERARKVAESQGSVPAWAHRA